MPLKVVGSLIVAILLCPPVAEAAKCGSAPAKGCILPFPSDLALTKRDASSATGRRVAIPSTLLPANTSGTHIGTADINRADGFSPGQVVLVRVPFLNSPEDAAKRKIVSQTNLGTYLAPAQPLLLLDEQTGARQPVWGEVDVHAGVQRLLMIHPATNLAYGHHFVVVLRNLGHKPQRRLVLSRAVRGALSKAHVSTKPVYSAWDFTVASQASIEGRLLAIRNDAFAQLGDTTMADGVIQGSPPQYTITKSSDIPPSLNPNVARVVTGTITVPCYLVGDNQNCPVGAGFHYDSTAPDAAPTQVPGQTRVATFQCNIPQAAHSAPSSIVLHGHGLLGDEGAVNNPELAKFGQAHDVTFCATQFSGMAKEDTGTFVAALSDLTKVSLLADRTQQGLLANLYLGRLLAHPQGLAADPHFAGLIDPARLSYTGQSQGAVLGGALTAVAPDWSRAALSGAGMGWGTVFLRSSKFPRQTLDNAYYRTLNGGLIGLAAVQLLWDRAETEGWAANATSSPPAATPAHQLLLQVAVGDPQVSTITADAEARAMGAGTGPLPVRSSDVAPLFGIAPITSYPFAGSAIVYYDNGPQTPLPPTTDTPQTTGADPHNQVLATRAAQDQQAAFLAPGGAVTDVCGGQACRTDTYG